MSARRPWAWPLVPVYATALAAKDGLRHAGVLRSRELHWPVLSVGSLSAGGAGKTPVVIALTQLLTAHGWQVDVLSRGYGRLGRGCERVVPGLVTPHEAALRFGDEPTLIAERTDAEVWVGADRWASGRAIESEAEATPFDGDRVGEQRRVHLLDDGLQHRQLRRDFDLVVLTAEDLGDHLLPAGNLREPLARLAEADAIAVREEELGTVEKRLRELLPRVLPLWTVRRALRFPQPLGVFAAGLRPLAMCALARPEGFAAALRAAGCGVVDTVVFPDHHHYTDASIAETVALGRRLRASGVVTTEKDAVKLSPAMRERLERELGPVAVVALDAAFVFESPVIRTLEERLSQRAAMADSRDDGTVAERWR